MYHWFVLSFYKLRKYRISCFIFSPTLGFSSQVSVGSVNKKACCYSQLTRGVSRISSKFMRNRSFYGCSQSLAIEQGYSCSDSTHKCYICRGYTYSFKSPVLGNFRHHHHHHLYHQSSSVVEEELDPFSLVADELKYAAGLDVCSKEISYNYFLVSGFCYIQVPKLASTAEYFFKKGLEGNSFVQCILLLMGTALKVRLPEALAAESADIVPSELRLRQRGIAETTELIHVASLLHDDVLDDADTRRGVGSLNFVMGNKVARLLASVVEHLVTGETMQMTSTTNQRHKYKSYISLLTYYKTASLISNSCKAIALLAGPSAEVAMLAFEYGKNLDLAFQLIDDVLDFTGTYASFGKGSLSDIQHGILKTPILFLWKTAAIGSLPETDDEDVKRSRRALIDMTHRVITRNK
ncbi:hypothetical protein Bca52824_028787 [Brassica carinata]|uniref:Uncharacterized protein n=1 Tax=Brassica carinata TaxID=52824 RepID=A0A8X8ANG2_BRACI|nr:hypothetical protein Bca52824_028787 [Brassica carinata]